MGHLFLSFAGKLQSVRVLKNRVRANFLPNLFLALVVRVLFATTPPVPGTPPVEGNG